MELENRTIHSNDTCQPDAILGERLLSLDALAVKAVAWIVIFSLFAFLSTRELYKRKKSSKSEAHSPIKKDSLKMKRKEDFLSRVGDAYGYKGTKGGFIDDWRPKELPHLQLPLSGQSIEEEDDMEREVYLDYAGSALPTKSQLEKIFTSASSTTLANPHSTGPAASRTLLGMEQAKTQILNRFHAAPGRLASLDHPPSSLSNQDRHPGYGILFTSGTTQALRIIAERFPWRKRCLECGRQSIFLYAQNSHSSVVGMRELALGLGARFHCCTIEEIQRMDKEGFERLENESMTSMERWNNCICCQDKSICNLLVFPAECNFGGHRPISKSIIGAARESGWFTMLDIAKAASTGPIDLRDENPDFACISFYKMFGAPTGLGSLFVKRSTTDLLFQNKQQRRYVGGGSLNLILTKKDFLSQSNNLASLTSGSSHFRGILQLSHGFDEIDRLGGMSRVHQHATTLVKELNRRLQATFHGNGRPVVVIYGAWGNAKKSFTAGPTAAMNILRDDGSVVGYNEVAKLAALHKPAIQFRTGCFCNPGACQEALKLSDEQLIHNFEVAGHVCGDHMDLIDGEPTGAIRISFGKDSLWEDLDEFVLFVERTFVNKYSSEAREISTLEASAGPAQVTLTELYVFPIKSCAAQCVPGWRIDLPSGKLAYDREFALVDASGTALRLQNFSKMGTISPRIDLEKQTMTVAAPGWDDLVLSLSESYSRCAGSNDVSVCGYKCGGRLWGGWKASEWFSSFLGVQCWLARYSDEPARAINPRHGFANDQPLLLISENAVQALNEVLSEQKQKLVGSKHFRPNMVVHSKREYKGGVSHIEDGWKSLVLKKQGLTFEVKGDCARCSMVDYDPSTGSKGKTLRALAKYRRRNGQITFGIFLRAVATGDAKNQWIWIKEGEVLLGL
jgi:molybdenum cofactor sulfurtransferase